MVIWREGDRRMCRREEADRCWVSTVRLFWVTDRLGQEPDMGEEKVRGRTRTVSCRKVTDLGYGGKWASQEV